MHKINSYSMLRYRRQQGVALVVSIIFLTVLTLLGLSAMRSTTLGTKMAVNHQFKQLSFQAAESALARLTGPDPEVQIPLTEEAAPVENRDYFSAIDVPNQPDMSADLTVRDLIVSAPGQYKFSGYGLSVTTFVYTATAVGSVGGSHATAANQMQIALIRE